MFFRFISSRFYVHLSSSSPSLKVATNEDEVYDFAERRRENVGERRLKMWKFNRSLVLLKHFRNCLYRLQFVQLQLIAASEAFVVPAAAIPLVDQLVEISFTPFPVE